jgi:hypothetical protein
MPNDFTGAQTSPSSSLPKRLKRAPVDKMCPDAAQYEVYVDDTGLAWDACLNKVNISMNNNLFYFLQLLTTTAQSQFFVWSRWGRGAPFLAWILEISFLTQPCYFISRSWRTRTEQVAELQHHRRSQSPVFGCVHENDWSSVFQGGTFG